MLEREGDLVVQWELGALTDLHLMLETIPVDVVLMDLNLGSDQDALAATTEIRHRYESVKIIIVSGSLDWESATAARAAGAHGYLPKDLSIPDMMATIRALGTPTSGRAGFRDMLVAQSNGSNRPLSLRRGLSPREQDVLAELRRGRTNKEIAQRLGVSITTVNKHVQHVLKKLHVRTRAHAVAMVDAAASGRPYPVGDRR